MLDAVQPVVLAPAVEYKPSGAVGSTAKEGPLVSFTFTRSFAGSGEGEGGAGGGGGDGDGDSEAGASMVSVVGSEGGLDRQSIKSFKDIRLDIGALAQEVVCGSGSCRCRL